MLPSASSWYFSLLRLLDITTTLLLGLPGLDCRAEVPVRKRGDCYGRAQIFSSKKNKAIYSIVLHVLADGIFKFSALGYIKVPDVSLDSGRC